MDDKVTKGTLAGLSDNIRAVFAYLHPAGLSMAELAEKAEKHAFYKGVYRHARRVRDGNNARME